MKRIALAVILMVGLAASPLFAQVELSGRIEGTVKDEAGAVVPRASVTATHVATNTVHKGTTSEVGRFIIPTVRLGRYTLVVEMPGFRRAVVNDVIVEVGGATEVPVTLQVGVVEEEIVVEAVPALINTMNAELSTVVDERRVLELPLDGRNAMELTFLQAGTWYELNPVGTGDKLIIHGQRNRSLNITLDGVDTQDNLNRADSIQVNQPLVALPAENVQEFRVITGLSSAEFGRGGVQIIAVTRSGTNEFHGSLFWFHRNDVFGANDFFQNLAGQPKSPLVRNQFGGRIGGPIFKDKTFFFFGYQQTRESRGVPRPRSVYTEPARRGIFRYRDGGVIRQVNLFDLCAFLNCYGGAYAAIAANPIDPFIADTVLGSMPASNVPGGDLLNISGFQFSAPVRTFEHLPNFRIDHRISDKHSFYATFNYLDREIQGDVVNDRESRFPTTRPMANRVTHSKSFSVALISSLTPTFINEFRVAALVHGENTFQVQHSFDTPFVLSTNIRHPTSSKYLWDANDNLESRDNDTWHVRDTVSWVRGRHTIKAGFEFRHRWVHTYGFDLVNPQGDFDLDFDENDAGFDRTDIAAFIGGGAGRPSSTDLDTALGLINDLTGAIGESEVRFNVTSLDSGFVPGAPERRIFQGREFDAFINDTWNVTPNLTLNLGLRWEWAGVPYETRGVSLIPEGGEDAIFGVSGREGLFNPGVLAGTPCPTLNLPTSDPARAPTRDNARALITSCSIPNVPGGSTNGLKFWNDDLNNFGPVVSLAWDPWGDGRTSIRAGFRISYFQDAFAIVEDNVDDNQGLRLEIECVPRDGECANNPLFIRDIATLGPPIPATPTFDLSSPVTILNSSTQGARMFINDLETPYYIEWTLGIQREIGLNTALEVRYVGNHGVRLRRVRDFNEINIFAFDPNTGQSFLQAFLIAQQNLACNRANGAGSRFDTRAFPCSIANPLMDVLIAGQPSRLRSRSGLRRALDRNAPGQFVHRLTQRETSRVNNVGGTSRIRGGSWWGAVLRGDLPVNFFMANPFLASSLALTGDGTSSYHALEIEVRRRFGGGFMLQGNYTFQRALSAFDGDDNNLFQSSHPSNIRNRNYTKGGFHAPPYVQGQLAV
ncbi:TonB-dependent receptor [Acidobacteriia bacterium AH_259_A11_L15]|nr:TonB-dependent receptor [Acidobacteriia bacterium AH_259_A11_L15]